MFKQINVFIQGKRNDQMLKRRNITEDESVSPLKESNSQKQVLLSVLSVSYGHVMVPMQFINKV